MNDLEIFHNRMKKIGIDITFSGNFPWVYLDTVCGRKVKGLFLAEHGFTAFFAGIKPGQKAFNITEISTVFAKIRETLKLIR